jgi:hypothetical protein
LVTQSDINLVVDAHLKAQTFEWRSNARIVDSNPSLGLLFYIRVVLYS